MISNRDRLSRFVVTLVAALMSATCGSGGGGGGGALSCTPTVSLNTLPARAPTGVNVMPVTVNGALCTLGSQYNYKNEPCVSVTICTPGTSTCQTIKNILLDTGSFGLRVFSSLVTVSLTAVTSGSNDVADCVQFGDGSSEWGQVKIAGVKLGGESAVNVPIQLVNSSYATPPPACSSTQSTPDTSPQEAGFNGILGVGLLNQDCGGDCTSDAGNGQYFGCSGSACTGITATLAQQVANPVANLPQDNNGVILELPAVAASGASSASGYLVFGIGTQSNNVPTGVSTYAADQYQSFNTNFDVYSGLSGFIDSGSNFYYVPEPSVTSLPDCGGTNTGLFCPSAAVNLAAQNVAASGPANSCVGFQVANADSLLFSSSAAFDNVAGSSGSGTSAYFDWGLPFFFGRSVYVGFQGASSSLGRGPYWAY